MKLSIVFKPSLSNVKTAFSLMSAGFFLLLGREVSIENEMESSDLTDAIIEDMKRQQKAGKLDMTLDQLRESLASKLSV